MADGLVGISERLCVVSSYDTSVSDRNIHCHLYNRYISENYSTYNRYYVPVSEKVGLVSRELTYNEKTGLTSSYNTLTTEKFVSHGSGYTIETNERQSTYKLWYTQPSERYLHYAITELSERNGYWFSKWNTYRFGYAKSWYVSERYSSTLGKVYDSYADQRTSWYQLYSSPVSIRSSYYESCHTKFSFTVNPSFNTLLDNVLITPLYQPLFEEEPVTDYKLEYNYLGIKDNLKDTDLAIVLWNPSTLSYIEYPLSLRGITRIQLYKYGSTNTWFIDGFIVPVSDILYFYMYPLCNKYTLKSVGTDCLDTVNNEATEYGYIKLEVLGKQYKWGTKQTIAGDIKYKPLSFKFYIADEFINRFGGVFNIQLVYGYPDKNTVFKTVLSFLK